MLVNPFGLAERARFFEDNGVRLRANQLREALDRQGCCTECGSKLIFENDSRTSHRTSRRDPNFMCSGPRHNEN